MKKIACIVLLLSCIIAFSIFSNNSKADIKNSIVYIESISDENIKYGVGFVYKTNDDKDYILTNYHVVGFEEEIYVYDYKENKKNADILKYDAYNDLAILTIEHNPSLTEIEFGDSSKLNPYDDVYIYENLLIQDSIRVDGKIVGITSSLNDLYGFNPIEISINTSYGDSGSPVIDKQNKVVGMMFLKNTESNIGYMIPINFVLDFIKN